MKATHTRIVLTSLTLALTASTAAADIRDDLPMYARAIADLKSQYSRALRPGPDPVAACRRVVADARAAGVRPTEALRDVDFENVRGAVRIDGTWQLAVRDAGNVCGALAYWRTVAKLEGAVSEAQSKLDWVAMIDKARNHPENAAMLAGVGNACDAAVDAAYAAGVAPDTTFPVHGIDTDRTLTLAAAKAQVCAKVAAIATTFAQDVERERLAAWERIAAPYKAAGVKGERLDYLVSGHRYAKYGVGGVELTTIKQLAKAKVMFEMLTGQGVVTLRRTEFKGDKLVGTSTQEFERRPGPRAYR
jgi:hypothetical protein